MIQRSSCYFYQFRSVDDDGASWKIKHLQASSSRTCNLYDNWSVSQKIPQKRALLMGHQYPVRSLFITGTLIAITLELMDQGIIGWGCCSCFWKTLSLIFLQHPSINELFMNSCHLQIVSSLDAWIVNDVVAACRKSLIWFTRSREAYCGTSNRFITGIGKCEHGHEEKSTTVTWKPRPLILVSRRI